MSSAVGISSSKATIIQLSIMGAILIIVIRLLYLQLYCHHSLLSKSQSNFTRHETIWPQRGNILDCNGNLLVTNRPVANLTWRGTGKRQLSPVQSHILDSLESITKLPINHDTVMRIKHAEKYRKTQIIYEDIPLHDLSQIMELFPEHKNLQISTSFKRCYPYQKMASHILGYINQLQDTGQMGLEKLFDSALRGEHGQFVKKINSTGRSLATTPLHDAIMGTNVTTTLDLPLQLIAERVFPPNEAGTLIVMDPSTGALRVIVSRPNFDPSIFIEGIEHTTWQELTAQKPFVNRAFNACYPPASIFKLVTIAAALEEGIITSDAAWYCKGYITFGRRTRCNNQHGWVDVKQAISESCNIPFYQIGQHMHIDTLANYAFRFGLGQKTGILFPERTGLVPTAAWKQEQIGERWWPGETLSATIGQTYLLVTPLQIATMISSIFTGYRIRPRLLPHEAIEHTPLDLSYQTRLFLQKAMRAVVKGGKAKQLHTIDGIKGYAKTGTAQTSNLNKRHLGKQYKEHASLAGYFQYKDTEPITLVIVIERTGSSRSATRVAKQFLVQYRDLMREQEEASNITAV